MNFFWTLALLLALAFAPTLLAILRGSMLRAAAYAVVSICLVVLPGVVRYLWEAANPDQSWSMAAPAWLMIGTGPFVTLPLFWLATWVLHLRRKRQRKESSSAPATTL